VTVFVSMKGQGGEWHLYGVDGCALTQEEIPLRFVQPMVTSNGLFQATITGRANRSNIVEASGTLTGWTVLTNFLNETGSTSFSDSAGAARRFYRARPVP